MITGTPFENEMFPRWDSGNVIAGKGTHASGRGHLEQRTERFRFIA